MKFDPETTVAALLEAIPSSALAFEKLGLPADPEDRMTVQQVCRSHDIRFETFLQTLEAMDWEEEISHPQPPQPQSEPVDGNIGRPPSRRQQN